ncbi:signal recognition particle-docking protein FtsY, partial [Brucella melitensis]
MAMGFIKKMFSFGKKEVEEKPAEQPAPYAVEISAPDVTEAPVAEESVIVSEPEP